MYISGPDSSWGYDHGVDRIAQVYEKTGRSGNMIFIVRESELTNQRGEKVAVVRQSLIRRD